MPKEASKNQYTDYDHSLIANTIHYLLSSLDTIQKKYSNAPHNISAEETHAVNQIEAIREFLTNINLILKKFSKGSKPGASDFIGFGHKLYKLKHFQQLFKLNQSGEEVYGYVIKHPMNFELATILIQIVQELPLNSADLLSFYNPESLVMDFTGTTKAFLVKSFINGGFKIERRHPVAEGNEYDYVVTAGGKAHTINAQNVYETFKRNTQSHLLQALQVYFQQYAESTHVKTEKAKGVVYSKFLEDERNRLKEIQTKHKIQIQTAESINPGTNLTFLNAKISQLKESLKQNNQINQDLLLRKADFDRKSLCQLYEQDKVYQFKQDAVKNLDHSYWEHPIPNVFIGCVDDQSTVGIMGIKSALNQEIGTYCTALAQEKEGLESELSKLEANRKNLVDTRIKVVLNTVSLKRNAMSDKLSHSANELHRLQQLLDESLGGLNIEQLKHLSEQYSIALSTLAQIVITCNTLSNELSQEKSYSYKELTSEENASLQNQSKKCYDTIENEVAKLSEQSRVAIKLFENKLAALKVQLQKLEEQELLSFNIRKSGIDEIPDLVLKLDKQLEATISEIVQKERDKEAQKQRNSELDVQRSCIASKLQKHSSEKQVSESELINKTKAITEELKIDGELTLSTLENYISNALNKVTAELSRLQQNTSRAQQIQECDTKILALQSVREFLNSSKDPNISLDKLLALKELKFNSKWSRRLKFNCLFELLGKLDKAEQWDKYFNNQKQYLPETKNEKWVELHDLIITKVEYYRTLKSSLGTEGELIQKYILAKKRLVSLSKEFQDFNTCNLKMQAKVLELESQLEQVNSILNAYKNSDLERDNSITLLKGQEQTIQGSKLFLLLVYELKQRLDTLLNNIVKAEGGITDPNLNLISLAISEFLKESKQHENLLEDYRIMSDSVAAEYRPMLDHLGAMNTIINNRIQELINNTYGKKLGSLLSTLAVTEGPCAEINRSLSLAEKVKVILKHKDDLLEPEKRCNAVKIELSDICTQVKLINNPPQLESLFERVNVVYDIQEKEMVAIQKFIQRNTEDLVSGLKDTLVEPINATEFSREYLNGLDERLVKAKSDLNELKRLPLKPADYESVNSLIEQKQKELQSLRQTVERKELVAEFKKQIIHYLTKRNLRYKYKDMIFSVDKSKRTQLLTAITGELDTYVSSGDATKLTIMLREAKINYPGIQLRALLNKILVGIKDTDAKCLVKDSSDPELLIDGETPSITVLLDQLKKQNPVYVRQILLIKQKLKCLEDYGLKFKDSDPGLSAEILKFKSSLDTRLDQFIRDHEKNPPTQDELKAFQQDFIIRIHANDDVMSDHRHAWKPIIANLVIAVLSLGIAPALMLTYSKLSSGTCSLFFARTRRESLVDEISESAENMKLSSSVSSAL